MSGTPISTPLQWTRRLLVLIVAASMSLAGSASARRATKPGELRYVSPEGKTLGTMKGRQSGDAFGIASDAQAVQGTRGGGIMVGAPGTDGGGRVYLFDLGDLSVFDIVDAAELGGGLGRLGESVRQIGHIDGDPGVHFAIGAPGDPSAPAAPGAVVILHQVGRDYVERDRIGGSENGSLFGWRVATVDYDFTDSIVDHIAVAAPRESKGAKEGVGSVTLYDTVTGTMVWKAQGRKAHESFGYSLWPVPDINGDGVADLIVGAPGRRNRKPAGRVIFLSGATGKPIGQVKAPREAALFGFDVVRWVATGDLLVGAPATSIDGIEGAGAAYFYPGGESPPVRIDGDTAGAWLGLKVALSDIDRDGDVDAMAADLLRADRAKKDHRGRVSFFDLAAWTPAGTFQGKRGGDYFGLGGFALTSDRDGDGVFDYIASVPRAPLAFIPE